MKRQVMATIALGVLMILGCSSQGESGKGEESQMPVDGSADSFFSPTEHGELMFGVENSGELAADAGYHTWTFTLTGAAKVRLEVKPDVTNFDTVMYLYKNQESGSWGSYIAKNDDYEDNVWSVIEKDLDAGDYKVLLKGYKEKIRGSFGLEASCSGDGCPGSSDGECEVENVDKGEWGIGPSCLDATLAILDQPPSTNGFFAGEAGLCSSPMNIQKAWHFYYSYMVEYYDEYWAEDKEDPDIDFGFEVESTTFGDAGWLMGVDCGADESAMSILYDKDLNTIMFYQHNQSPVAEWTCLEAGEKALEWESEWCIYDFLRNYAPSGDKTAPESGTVKFGEAKGAVPNAVTAVMYLYRDGEGLADDVEVTYTYLTWPGGEEATIYDVDLSSEGKSDMGYIVSTSEWDSYLYITESGAGKDFPCKSIDTDLE